MTAIKKGSGDMNDDFTPLDDSEMSELTSIFSDTTEPISLSFRQLGDIEDIISSDVIENIITIHDPLKNDFAKALAVMLVDVPVHLVPESMECVEFTGLDAIGMPGVRAFFGTTPFRRNAFFLLSKNIALLLSREDLTKLFREYHSALKKESPGAFEGIRSTSFIGSVPDGMILVITWLVEFGEDTGHLKVCYGRRNDLQPG
ncbi:MAG: hypothetical protein KBA61_11820 [Spirochaetes bacterium]|nr:hypothetical protein [Spirochaetota bacterium]